ncbi:MAG TPA: TM2 domain-containing protein [Kineobactrum sp.]
MKGQVLDYSVQANSGLISGADGNRYTFKGAQWKEDVAPLRGMSVDFEAHGSDAWAIYRVAGADGSLFPGSKSKIAAGLLAIFLGGFGIHKFYLGYTGPGLVYLLTNTIGWVITIFLLGIPNMVLGVIALIEGIIYLTRSDEEFQQTYVIGRKSWF